MHAITNAVSEYLKLTIVFFLTFMLLPVSAQANSIDEVIVPGVYYCPYGYYEAGQVQDSTGLKKICQASPATTSSGWRPAGNYWATGSTSNYNPNLQNNVDNRSKEEKVAEAKERYQKNMDNCQQAYYSREYGVFYKYSKDNSVFTALFWAGTYITSLSIDYWHSRAASMAYQGGPKTGGGYQGPGGYEKSRQLLKSIKIQSVLGKFFLWSAGVMTAVHSAMVVQAYLHCSELLD